MNDKNFGGSKFGNENSFTKDLAIARIIAQHRLNIFCFMKHFSEFVKYAREFKKHAITISLI